MTDPNPSVTRIYFYEVTADQARAVYAWRYEQPVASGKHQDFITAVAKDGKLPWDPGDLQRPRWGLSPLNIYVANDEVCAFAFHLNATDQDGKQRLAFVEPPFVNLPLNAAEGLEGMTEAKSYPENGMTGRWASFVCDLKKIRGGGLATRIRKLPKDHAGALKIPLWFNFVDPVLEGSPWVITTEDHERGRDGEHGHEHKNGMSARHGQLFTHGGVHPLALANLVVEL